MAVAALAAAVTTAVVTPALAGAQSLPAMDPQAAAQTIVLQAVRCDSFGAIPGNIKVDPALDDTDGGYRQWAPADGRPVSPVTFDAGQACQPVDGVRFRLSASPGGLTLSGRAAGFVPPGGEDGTTTALLAGATGRDGAGTLRSSVAALNDAQREALSVDGLWVAALDLPARFGNLRCGFDRYNADNLEVLRSVGPTTLACVLYLVGAGSPGAPTVTVAPTPPPADRSATPPSGRIDVPSAAPTPLSPTPLTPAPPTAPTPAGPTPTAPIPTAPTSTAPTPPTGAVVPLGDGSGTGDDAALVPVPVADATTAVRPSGPVADANGAAPVVPRSAAADRAEGRGAASSGGRSIDEADRESALAGWSTLSVVVEVGGVTKGAATARPGRVLSPWRAPIRVSYACGGRPGVEVEITPEKAPGYVVTGPSIGALPAEQCVIVPIADGLGDDGANGGSVVVTIGGRAVPTGTMATVAPAAGRDEVQRVLVSFSAAEVGTAGGADGSAGAPLTDGATTQAAGPVAVAGSASRLSPLTVTSLAVVFTAGLVLSLLAARRPL